MNKNKKILLIIIASIVGIIVVLASIVGILERREEKKAEEAREEAVIEYPFYPADFERNILEDETYLELMRGRFLHYCDSYTNITVSLTPETAAQHGQEVAFLVDYLYTIIKGDHEAYNDCFSEAYYASGNTPKDAFTMQQLHHIVLTKISMESASEDGRNYTKYLYSVEYLIHENNGTFRKDIGDGSKAQYLIVTDRSGEWKIDELSTVKTKIQ